MLLAFSNTKVHALLLVLLFCLTGFFATYHLTESPPVWYDEGFYVQSAANLATYGHTGLRVAPDIILPSSKLVTVGYPLLYPLAGWMKVFGVNILSARSLMVLFIFGFLAGSYLLVRRLFSPWLALGALSLLVTLPTLYGNGKDVLGEVPGLMYLVFFLFSFNIALSDTARKQFWFLLSGLSAGLCVVTKPTFLVLLPAIAIGIYIVWRREAASIGEILTAIVAGTVPLLFWLSLQFQAGDSLSSILAYYANPYELPNLLTVILENIRRLFLGIGPLYLVGVMGVWIYACWIRWRKQEVVSIAEIIALVFSLLIIAAYMRTAGWYRYLFEAQVMSLLFFPNAVLVVGRSVSHFVNPKSLVVAATVVLSIFGVYQVMFSSFVAESYHREKTAFLESYFASVSSTTSFFFYNVPEAAIFIQGANYYQYIIPAGGSIGEEQLPMITEGKVDTIILGSDTYTQRKDNFFKAYRVTQATHDYTILEKI